MAYLNASREYHCVYVNVESVQAAREAVTGTITAILSELPSGSFYYFDDAFLRNHSKDILNQSWAFAGLNEAFIQWSQASPLPLVILIYEINSLVGDTFAIIGKEEIRCH